VLVDIIDVHEELFDFLEHILQQTNKLSLGIGETWELENPYTFAPISTPLIW